MSTVQEIETAITQLSVEEMAAIRDWLEDQLEDQLEFTDEFQARIARAREEFARGEHSRVRQPGSAGL
jgi:urease accessory protein UreF